MAASSLLACSRVTPEARRRRTVDAWSRGAASGSRPSGVHTWPTSGNAKPASMMPMMRCGRPSSRRFADRRRVAVETFSPQRLRDQRHGGGLSGEVLVGRTPRPETGSTPSNGKRPASMLAPGMRAIDLLVDHEARAVEERDRGEGIALAPPVGGVASRDRVPALADRGPRRVRRHQALGIGEVERSGDPGVEALEHRGVGADAERQHDHDRDAREGVAPEDAQAMDEIAPHRSFPGRSMPIASYAMDERRFLADRG